MGDFTEEALAHLASAGDAATACTLLVDQVCVRERREREREREREGGRKRERERRGGREERRESEEVY